jgi:hypothetical protein
VIKPNDQARRIAMRHLRNLALLTVVLALGSSVASAQSLVDVAKKEKQRRDKNKTDPKRVITDRELAGGYGGLPPARTQTSSQSAPSDGSASADASATTDDGKGEPKQDPTKTQEYWQTRVKGSKDKIAKLEEQLKSNDWGSGQRVGVDPRGQTNLGDRDKVEQQLAAARSELDAIQSEARRAGVPPGWVR